VARIIGLTGGIASGKSTVSAMFRELGAALVDADVLAREVVAPGTEGLEAICNRFGPELVSADGGLDRKKLAQLVFSDEQARADLGRITHPRIAALSQERIAELASTGADPVLYDAALIVENKLHKAFFGLIVVAIPVEVQRARLMVRDEISEAEADARIQSQMPLAEKVAEATWVIDNSGSLSQTRAQVTALWDEIRSAK